MKKPAVNPGYLAPTRRAVLLMALGVPLSLALGMLVPGLWAIGAAWMAAIACAIVLDGFLGAPKTALEVFSKPPAQLFIGSREVMRIDLHFGQAAPGEVEVLLDKQSIVDFDPARGKLQVQAARASTEITLIPKRRGELQISCIWVRWHGPLGLLGRAVAAPLKVTIPVMTNIHAVRKQAMQIISRERVHGQKRQIDKGEGTEFDSLREFVAGMDYRHIDWKSSARHNLLLAKEFQNERNHNVMIALDTGHMMSAPIHGVPRLDHALQAGLLLAFIGLRGGDRVGFFAFDAEPVLSVRPVTHTGSFGILQRMTAGLGYSSRQSNYTLGLTRLLQGLDRRSLVVVFTDFSDTISAELMVENISRLSRKHEVIFVAFTDMELEEMVRELPQSPDDVSRAVIAAGMLKERDLVLARLHRLGVHILETEPDKLGADLVSSYLAIKAKGSL